MLSAKKPTLLCILIIPHKPGQNAEMALAIEENFLKEFPNALRKAAESLEKHNFRDVGDAMPVPRPG